MKSLLISFVFGLAGFAITALAFGLKLDNSALLSGAIGIATYVAIEAGKRRGVREAEFGHDSKETGNG